MSFGALNPLPPEIDPHSVGKTLFHAGGAERIEFALVVDHGQKEPLRYEVEIRGPVGTPKITRERLATTEPLAKAAHEPFIFLDFKGGKGVVRDQVGRKPKRPEWMVNPNELALRRALDPTLVTLRSVPEEVALHRHCRCAMDPQAGVARGCQRCVPAALRSVYL